MKKLFAFFILLCHLNFFMFMPQLDEVDHFANGCQVDDINSLYEYLDQVVYGHEDITPEDEDDDTTALANLIKIEGCSPSPFATAPRRPDIAQQQSFCPLFKQAALTNVFFDTPAPPPKS